MVSIFLAFSWVTLPVTFKCVRCPVSTCIVSTESSGKITSLQVFLMKALSFSSLSVHPFYSSAHLWEAINIEEYLCKAGRPWISDCRRGWQTGWVPTLVWSSHSFLGATARGFVTYSVAVVSKKTSQIMLFEIFCVMVLLHFLGEEYFLIWLL